jgi:hypothetical protein
MPPVERPSQPRQDQSAQTVQRPGQHTDRSLSDLLDVKEDDAASIELRQDLDRIREAELTAERNAAAGRIY